MKNTTIFCLAAALTVSVFGAACQQPATPNSALSNANAASGTPANSNSMDHSGHDMSNMQGHDMHSMGPIKSAPNAASQPYDLQFIDSMIHHHEGAIMMSEMAIGRTERPELKAFSQKIIDDQKKEIDEMKEWREKWYAGKPSALNMEMPGMQMGKMMDDSHTKEMQAMQGKDFDVHFIDMMTPHHEGAVKMAQEALNKAEHAEIKSLAEQIIKEQQAEIKQMQNWKNEWSK
jgi:uncharacterized protein (DUF305 family)